MCVYMCDFISQCALKRIIAFPDFQKINLKKIAKVKPIFFCFSFYFYSTKCYFDGFDDHGFAV